MGEDAIQSYSGQARFLYNTSSQSLKPSPTDSRVNISSPQNETFTLYTKPGQVILKLQATSASECMLDPMSTRKDLRAKNYSIERTIRCTVINSDCSGTPTWLTSGDFVKLVVMSIGKRRRCQTVVKWRSLVITRLGHAWGTYSIPLLRTPAILLVHHGVLPQDCRPSVGSARVSCVYWIRYGARARNQYNPFRQLASKAVLFRRHFSASVFMRIYPK